MGLAGLFAAGLIASLGTFWAFLKGGLDFRVFYHAWFLVLHGHGSEIYTNSPDRFLYAPGFAWLLAPLALFPEPVALGIWCFAKAAALGLILSRLSAGLRTSPGAHPGAGVRRDSVENSRARARIRVVGVSAWAVVLVARPVLIDFQYGQVNLFILAACVWALMGHFEKSETSPAWDYVKWAVLAIASLAKIFPLPLLLTPWTVRAGIDREKLARERLGILIGFALMLVLPITTLGFHGSLELFMGWKQALVSRGLPLESHNQSFTALLYHYFSGRPTPVLSAAAPMQFGGAWLSPESIQYFSLAWSCVMMGVFLGWIVAGSFQAPLLWAVVAIGLMILPSHLVWKPYFVLSLPVAVFATQKAFREFQATRWAGAAILAALFVGINLTGFDFVGRAWGAQLEAGAILLLMHLALIGYALWGDRPSVRRVV